MDTKNIRNFCIIAHIDHGKSTLADRLLEVTGTVEKRNMKEQTLDSMDLERERGITIKASAVELHYKSKDGQEYQLNLIDTPGHVDFAYEVQKSLQACEGAILLVDATQGVQAQTVANAHLAEQVKLVIVPAVNKVDLTYARVDDVCTEMENSLLIDRRDVLQVSGKSGKGVPELLEEIIQRIPAPQGDAAKPLRALIFDSVYNDYRGVIVYVRLIDGTIKRGDKIFMLGARKSYEVLEVGKLKPGMKPVPELGPGEVGYIISNIKSLVEIKIGDTITRESQRAEPLPGYKEPKPMVFCGFYPTNPGDFEDLREALATLRLNDSSFVYEPESSEALGFGFRCGFLGLLHMDIIQERLEREHKIDLVQTAPNVTYELELHDGTTRMIHRPSDLPEPHLFKTFREPIMHIQLLIPSEFIGPMMQLCTERRGTYVKTEYLSPERAFLSYDLPLAEIIYDFYDKLKSITRGYGTMDYELKGYEEADLVKMRILVHGTEVDALSVILHREQAEYRGRKILQRLRSEIPRHMFEVALQAAIGGKVIARENIKALAKDVTSKCYGGDITRKRKLLERQKEGKKRMKQVGNVEIPQKAFLSVLSTDED